MNARDAARCLVDARNKAHPIRGFPVGLAPESVQQAYAIQDEVIQLSGDVGGWKIAPRPNGGEFLCSPIPKSFFVAQDTQIERLDFLAPEAEIEIAIQFGKDLPPRADSYSLQETTEAIASFHPIIEILSSRFTTAGLSTSCPISRTFRAAAPSSSVTRIRNGRASRCR